MAQRDCRALQMQSKYNFFSIAPFQPRPFCDSAKAVECTQVPAQKNGPEMDRSWTCPASCTEGTAALSGLKIPAQAGAAVPCWAEQGCGRTLCQLCWDLQGAGNKWSGGAGERYCSLRLTLGVFCCRWIMTEHSWSSAHRSLAPTPTPGAQSSYLRVRAKSATPAAATSILWCTTKPPTTTSRLCSPALPIFPPPPTPAPRVSHQVLILPPAGAPPRTSSPPGCPTNSSELPCSSWSARETPGSTWTTSSRLGRAPRGSCASPPRSTRASRWPWRRWTSGNSRGGSCFSTRYVASDGAPGVLGSGFSIRYGSSAAIRSQISIFLKEVMSPKHIYACVNTV